MKKGLSAMGGGTNTSPGGWLATQVADQSASAKHWARLGACALAVLVWLAFAAEARAQEVSAPAGDPAATVGTPGDTGSAGETVVDDPAQAPSPETTSPQPAGEASPPEPPAPAEPPAAEAPPATPPPDPSPPSPATPAVEPPPALPAVEPPPSPVAESPVEIVTPPAPLPGVDPGQVDDDLQPGSIVIVANPSGSGLPELLPSGPGGRLAVVLTTAGGLFQKQLGSQSQSRQEPSGGAGRVGNTPPLPPAPSRPGVPPRLFLGGGVSGSSSGGFSALMLAFFGALFAAAAQSLGGLLPLRLSSPHCTRFAVCLERPD
jgi:hypothetical protein